MYKILLFFVVFSSACTFSKEKKESLTSAESDTTAVRNNDVDVNTAAVDTSSPVPIHIVPKIKNPSGIYRTVLPLNNKMEQTVAFNSDFTYQLQETYSGDKKDSVVVTEGTWMPSDGFIWLYKDQIARGRYKWKGDTLQYYSPRLKKSFSMHSLQDAFENTAWRTKSKEGVVAFGMGNEPFWRVEYTNKDTISFQLSDWDHPLKLKADSSFNNSDSTVYMARKDSVQLRVTIFPHFCSDGMSDFTYRNKIRVHYNQQVYNGCAIVYKQ